MASLSRSGTTHTGRSKAPNDNTLLTTNEVVLYDEEQNVPNHCLENSTRVGELSTTSTVGTDLGSDWGLVKLSDQDLNNLGPLLAEKKVSKDVVFSGRVIRSIPRDTV